MRVLVLPLALGIAGCATVAPVDTPELLFADHLFAPPPAAVDASNPFTLSEAMRAYIDGPLARRAREQGARQGLIQALREDVRLEYDATQTRTAAEAFDARRGNCLSLVIMASVLAHELGIPVQIQSVRGPDTWMREQGTSFRSSHVNLILGSRAFETMPGGTLTRPMVVDFLPPEEAARWPGRVIAEETVVAMYRNNRAAETLVDGDVATAYWWARAAITASPRFLPAFNTLAVVYMRQEHLPEAERVLRHALEREPENVEALTNLALALSRQGREAEAKAARLRLAEVAPHPPYAYLDQGVAALARGEIDEAARLIRKELQRMPYDDEVNLAFAVVTLRLGDVQGARKHMRRALENSPTQQRRDLYSSKLRHLQSLPKAR